MGKILVITNRKGGCGKSFTTANLGVGLARKGKKVLCIDTDNQHSLTVGMGVTEPEKLTVTIATIIADIIAKKDIDPSAGIIHHTDGIDLMPANNSLTGMELTLAPLMGREIILRKYINKVKPLYDFILIDTCPTLDMLTVNALAAADSAIIPVCPKFLDAKGLELLLNNIAEMREYINPNLSICGILLTMVDKRANFTKGIIKAIKEAYGEEIHIFKDSIPHSIRAAETCATGKSIFTHDPNGKVAAAYDALAKGGLKLSKTNTLGSLALKSSKEIFKSTVIKADGEYIVVLSLSELHAPDCHPFQVNDDEQMTLLVESIKQFGVREPGLARPRMDAGYELLCGNRRKRACELVGLDKMPVIVRELDDDLAIIAMVDSNLQQRETILPSEKAWAYHMKMEALNHNGIKGDRFSCNTMEEQTGESKAQIFHFIRLTELVENLLDMVDMKQLALTPAVELSHLPYDKQHVVFDCMGKYEIKPSLLQAVKLKKLNQAGTLTAEMIDEILSQAKGGAAMPKLKEDKGLNRFKRFLPAEYTTAQMSDVITKLLTEWKDKVACYEESDKVKEGGNLLHLGACRLLLLCPKNKN